MAFFANDSKMLRRRSDDGAVHPENHQSDPGTKIVRLAG